MTWQIAFTIATILAVGRILYTRRYAQRSNVPATLPPAASYVFGVLPVGLVAGSFIFPHEVQWSWSMLILSVILSVSMTLANWWGFLVARKVAIAPQQTIGTLTNVSIVIMGWILLGEILTTQQLVGGGVLLAAALLAIWAPTKISKATFRRMNAKTIILTIGTALMLAIGLVSEKALLDHMDIGGIFLISWPVQAAGLLLLASKDISRSVINKFKGSELRSSILIGLSNGLNGLFYIYAIFYSDNISLITTLGTIILPLTVLGAYIFLKEREHHFMMWLSLIMALFGLVIVAT